MNMARIESHPGLFGNPYMDTKSKTHEANPQKGFVVQINASENFGLRWAAQRGYLSEDTAWIHPPAPVQRRKRILSRDELTNSRLSAAVTPTCPSCPGSR